MRHTSRASVDFADPRCARRELESFVYAGDHEKLLQAIAQGKFSDMTSLITRRIPLEDLVDKGIMALIHEKHEHGPSTPLLASAPDDHTPSSEDPCASLIALPQWHVIGHDYVFCCPYNCG